MNIIRRNHIILSLGTIFKTNELDLHSILQSNQAAVTLRDLVNQTNGQLKLAISVRLLMLIKNIYM